MARAVRLATDKPFYFAEKQKLWSKRSTAPLFDTEAHLIPRAIWTKHTMHLRYNTQPMRSTAPLFDAQDRREPSLP